MYAINSFLIFVVGNICSILWSIFIQFRAQINSQHAMDNFYTRFTRILQIFIICKYVFLIITFIVSAVFFIANISIIPFITHTIISVVFFAIQLAIFGWMSFKVSSLLTKNPTLKLVRTKVCISINYISFVDFNYFGNRTLVWYFCKYM